mmetsp:Transcript_30160/g.46073  ORF Transcript_30160/g.46073 Transcript_30160/m.46073 type:complete len:128 (-) Transcript_30160:628-1011(-)
MKNAFFEKAQLSKSFPFTYKYSLSAESVNGWDLASDIESELARQGLELASCDYLQAVDNSNFSICSTYPPKLVLPAKISLESIVKASKFRTKQRLPALTYFHKETGCTIWRSSQPMNAIMNHSNQED